MRVVQFILLHFCLFVGASSTTTSLTNLRTLALSHRFAHTHRQLSALTTLLPLLLHLHVTHLPHLHTPRLTHLRFATLTQRDPPIMSRPVAGGATTSPSRDIMIRTASSDLAATETSAPEEPAILALPVELQKTIVEYVSTSDRVYPRTRRVH